MARISRQRLLQGIKLMLVAAPCLYVCMIVVAEPLKGLSATSANVVVSLEIAGTASIFCSSSVAMTTSTGAIPGQYVGTGGTYARCTVATTNSPGYTMRWIIQTGSGGYGTGHLNSNNVTGGQPDRILAYRTATGAAIPETFSAPNTPNPNTTSRWAARVKSASTTTGGAGKDWGTDGSSEKWLNVGTGAAVSLVKRTSAATEDIQYVQFKGYIGSSSAQPTGTYTATVILSILDN